MIKNTKKNMSIKSIYEKNQIDVLDKFNEHYYIKRERKGILYACCGFGKTKTMCKIIEFEINKGMTTFVVITKTKILVKDIINEMKIMKKSNDNKMKIISAYSDGDVKGLGNVKNYNDISKKFIGDHIKIIITTYATSPNLKKFIKWYGDMNIDTIIYDESHNTTGENMINYSSMVLEDNELRFGKQIFITATPCKLERYIDGLKIFDDKNDIYTMNNVQVYGEPFYKYSFYRGINDGILCDFQTIFLSNNEEYNQKIDDDIQSLDTVQKKKLYYKIISRFLLNSLDKYGLKKMIVYQSSVDKCQQFLNELKCNIYSLDNPLDELSLCYDSDIEYDIDDVDLYQQEETKECDDDLSNYFNYMNEKAKNEGKTVEELFKQSIDDRIAENEKYMNMMKYDNLEIYILTNDVDENDRNKIINHFENDNVRTIILSVQIFNEGINLPMCDSIFFCEDKFNPVVVTQNIGRCLRQYHNKNMSYVLIPNFKYNLSGYGVPQSFETIKQCLIRLKSPENSDLLNDSTDDVFYCKNYADDYNVDAKTKNKRKYNSKKNKGVNDRIVNIDDIVTNVSSMFINIDYVEFHKKYIIDSNVRSIITYSMIMHKLDDHIIFPHIIFMNEFISYEHFFCENGAQYVKLNQEQLEDIINVIKRYFNIHSMNDLIKVQNNYIKNVIRNGNCKIFSNDANNLLLRAFTKLPFKEIDLYFIRSMHI